MAGVVPPGTNESKKPNPVKDEPVIPSVRVPEPKDLSPPEVLEILETEIPEPAKPRDTSAELKIDKVEIPVINTADVVLAAMGAPVYVARNSYDGEAPVNKDELTQAEIDALSARNNEFTGTTQAAQNKRLMSELSGNSNYDGVAGARNNEDKEEKRRRYEEDALMLGVVMTMAELEEAYNDYSNKADKSCRESERVQSFAKAQKDTVDYNAIVAQQMLTDERNKLDDLRRQLDAETDPAKKAELTAEIEKQEKLVKFADENLSAQQKLAADIQTKMDENNRLRESILEERERIDRKLHSGRNLSEDERRQLQDELKAADARIAGLDRSNTDLEAKAKLNAELSDKMAEFTKDKNLTKDELSKLVHLAGPDEDMRKRVIGLGELAGEANVKIDNQPVLDTEKFWNTQFSLYDLEQRQYELNKKLAENPNDPELLKQQEQLDFEKSVFEAKSQTCFRPGGAHLKEAWDSQEYKDAENAVYDARNNLGEATKNTVNLGDNAFSIIVYADGQDAEGKPNYYVYQNGEKVYIKDQTDADTLRAQIEKQLNQEGKTLGNATTADLERTLYEAEQRRNQVEKEQEQKTYEKGSQISAASQVETPGEPLNAPDMNGHFTAAAQQQPTLTNGLGQNLDAANDPNFNSRSTGLNA